MTLGLLYADEGDDLPLAIASDRSEQEIRRFLHLHGYRCRPSRFIEWRKIFPPEIEPEWSQLLDQMLVRNPKGVNYGRHAFYELAGDAQLLARKHLAEAHFTRRELAMVLSGNSHSFQHLFAWQRHVRTYYTGMIELVPYCHHQEAERDCELCQAHAAPPQSPPAGPKPEGPEWRPTRRRRGRRNTVHASPARWEEWRIPKHKFSPPEGQTGGITS